MSKVVKTVTVGDIHGRTSWKSLVPDEYDKIIFVGDYCDGWVDADSQIDNLKEIIEFKKKYPAKVVLLIGNHDLHYMYYPNYMCSRFDAYVQIFATPLFQDNKALFQVAFQIEDYLWTHAGLSKTWIEACDIRPNGNFDKLDVELNALNNDPSKQYILHIVGVSRGGKAESGGITWADKVDTKKNFPDDLHQIVGHSRVKRVKTKKNEKKSGSITYTDCLDTVVQFYRVNIEVD